MNWLALDIGGANLKVADGKGFAESRFFAMWREAGRLSAELRSLIAESPPCDHLAVTMTGELADCYASKAEGVAAILDAVIEAADARHTRVYLGDGRLVTPQIARQQPKLAAAANWHALARFCGRFAPRDTALLIDIGSTTTDLVPLHDGRPTTNAASDTARLLSGELVYTGVVRSPVAAVAQEAPYRGERCAIAQELFATMLDVYLLLEDIPEDSTNRHTADRRPAVKSAAHLRLARMLCADAEEFTHRDALDFAQALAAAQEAAVTAAAGRVLARLPKPPETVILSGQGEFLARRVLSRLRFSGKAVSLGSELGAAASQCAPAHALAVLAREASGV